MQFFALTIASLAALASAAPSLEARGVCTPATYACTSNPTTGCPGWQVCNTSGQWEYGGDCPPETVCKFYEASHSPYCVPAGYQFP